ncbi:MAG: ATP-binding cassette domain-containing protein [Alphaproteobacteria bacterium]|nr:ATP-binding cassette domain-containing protein [Alphaproteobacteria bacterium]
MIALENVHLTLTSAAGPVKILRGVDLAVQAGRSVSVIGPSGSGKSTLMAVAGGIERPSHGEVAIDGQDLNALNEDELASFRGREIGILFQSFHLIPTMTALENVAVPLELAGEDGAFSRAAEGLDAVHLAERADHYPGQLSGGEQQRVALARALANRPKLLLADEPTGNLDQVTGQEIVELMFGIQRERVTTLLLITHEPALAERCDHQYRMADGRLQKIAPESKPERDADLQPPLRSDEVA